NEKLYEKDIITTKLVNCRGTYPGSVRLLPERGPQNLSQPRVVLPERKTSARRGERGLYLPRRYFRFRCGTGFTKLHLPGVSAWLRRAGTRFRHAGPCTGEQPDGCRKQRICATVLGIGLPRH